MKIYVMCEPSKFNRSQRIQEIINSITVTTGSKTILLQALNTLVPVAPAVMDNLPKVIK